MRKHYVTFMSPGSFFSESAIKPIAEWSPRLAVEMAETILERYNAKPYGFYFTTRLSAAPVSDGEGGSLNVEEKEIARSGPHFLGGKLRTLDEVVAENNTKEDILRSNMRCNGCWIVIENTNSWKSTMPFEESAVVVDARGEIVERGDAPKHIAYREAKASSKT